MSQRMLAAALKAAKLAKEQKANRKSEIKQRQEELHRLKNSSLPEPPPPVVTKKRGGATKTSWPKGFCPNPHGRRGKTPRGASLGQVVSARVDVQRIAKSLIQRAYQGDDKALSTVVDLMERQPQREPQSTGPGNLALLSLDELQVAQFLQDKAAGKIAPDAKLPWTLPREPLTVAKALPPEAPRALPPEAPPTRQPEPTPVPKAVPKKACGIDPADPDLKENQPLDAANDGHGASPLNSSGGVGFWKQDWSVQ